MSCLRTRSTIAALSGPLIVIRYRGIARARIQVDYSGSLHQDSRPGKESRSPAKLFGLKRRTLNSVGRATGFMVRPRDIGGPGFAHPTTFPAVVFEHRAVWVRPHWDEKNKKVVRVGSAHGDLSLPTKSDSNGNFLKFRLC